MKNGRVVLDTENVRVRMHEVEKGKMSFAIEGYGSREAGMDDLYVWIDKLTTGVRLMDTPGFPDRDHRGTTPEGAAACGCA